MYPTLPSLVKVALIVFLVDLFWLATGGIYGRASIERIQGHPIEFRFLSAIMVYLFVAYMVLETTSYKQAFLYGMCIYGVYDFTSLSVFTHYDWKFALADTLWGGVLFVLSKHLIKAF